MFHQGLCDTCDSQLAGSIVPDGEPVSMDTQDQTPVIRWYRRPATAVTAGVALACAMSYAAVGQGVSLFGSTLFLAVPLFGPVIPGFFTGLICGRDGDKWAAVTAGLFTIGLAVYSTRADTYWDKPTIFMMVLGFGVIATALAALAGKLGEISAGLPPRVLAIRSGAVAIAVTTLVIAYWAYSATELSRFKNNVLPVIAEGFSKHVIKLPSDTRWTVERNGSVLSNRHFMAAGTRIRGHRLDLSVLPGGDRMFMCRCSYEPPSAVNITDEKSAAKYLKGFGVADEVIRHLRPGRRSFTFWQSWFCSRELIPHPGGVVCKDRPSCGEDFGLIVFPDGTIRTGHRYAGFRR